MEGGVDEGDGLTRGCLRTKHGKAPGISWDLIVPGVLMSQQEQRHGEAELGLRRSLGLSALCVLCSLYEGKQPRPQAYLPFR